MRKHTYSLLGLMAAVLLSGCSGAPSGKLSGKVTFNNKPVSIGTVLVVSEDGKSNGIGTLQEDGSYTIERAPVGNVKLAVQIPKLSEGADEKKLPAEVQQKIAEMTKKSDVKELRKGFNIEGATPEQINVLKALQRVPERFFSPNTSGLKTTVNVHEETSYDIVLAVK
jgi:hypothetical protein